MEIIENARFDEERALYARRNLALKGVTFAGERDGESPLKECSDILVEDSVFSLRYPMWHDSRLTIRNSRLEESSRAPIWYSDDVRIESSVIHGPKAIRECGNVAISSSDIVSAEFLWKSRNIRISSSSVEAEYFALDGENIEIDKVTFKGKYSFQYVKGGSVTSSRMDTKDAFWHADGLTIRDSLVKGEYLAWYSRNLTFINCRIIGTQPFCHAGGLRLIDCSLEEADLAFEKSEVDATLTEPIDSIKNPRRGTIRVPAVKDVIMDDPLAEGRIVISCR